MVENIFLEDRKKFTLADYMNFNQEGRGNLGEELPITVYRLLEYSLREELSERYGREEEIKVFRGAGFRAGVFLLIIFWIRRSLLISLYLLFSCVWPR